jgi:uncharacterized protein with NAD-binding domain and iron-sulfur cluster
VSRSRPDVAILGGGMAAMATAWRLSEPGRRSEVGSITVYQRGWRLGGKGASSRGAHGRIEEHGLHLWLGYYENAFRLLREVYAELDRPRTDPTARIQTWRDAMRPTQEVGLEDRDVDGWHHWVGLFSPNDQLPGEPDGTGGEVTVVDMARRALRLVADFLASLPTEVPVRTGRVSLSDRAELPAGVGRAATGIPIAVAAGILEAATRLHAAAERDGFEGAVGALDGALSSVREALTSRVDEDADLRRTWHLVSVMTACVRGVLADGLLTDPRGFHAIDDEDFLDWITRHGAAPEVADFAFIRGLYDLVFADGGEDRGRDGVGAGVAVFMTSKMFFEYKGAIFWKMAAGMGDVVFAPMYEALRRRGVRFELFHRVDQLHLSEDRTTVDAITVGRQAHLADHVDHYEPLIRVADLPGFPAEPLVDQLRGAEGIVGQPLESHWCAWPDAERRTLRRGQDFDVVVFAIPVAMAEVVCGELIADRPEWKAMVHGVSTTATQAVQLWLREDERSLGWPHPGATVSAYAQPFNTWASMDQLVDVEPWPEGEQPRTIAYLCGALDAPWPAEGEDVARARRQVQDSARHLVEHDLLHLLPGTHGSDGFRWELLCGAEGRVGAAALDTQLCLANVDPSDRYVRCSPGTDRYRLRPDESGYDNLFLAGDWTDSGLNAGCIEAAAMSGLQAANAVLGRPRRHRIAGFYMR